MNNPYIIKTVDDFKKVPANQLQQCFKELIPCIEIAKKLNLPIKHYTWIDDGKNDITIKIYSWEVSDDRNRIDTDAQ